MSIAPVASSLSVLHDLSISDVMHRLKSTRHDISALISNGRLNPVVITPREGVSVTRFHRGEVEALQSHRKHSTK